MSVSPSVIVCWFVNAPPTNTGSGYSLNENTWKNNCVTFGTESIISSNRTSVPSLEGVTFENLPPGHVSLLAVLSVGGMHSYRQSNS